MIREITAADVIRGCRQIVGLPTRDDDAIEDALLAALLRRAGGILCPCSRTSLRAAVLEGLRDLIEDDTLSERIDAIIEGLIIGGDLLELHDVATADQAAKGTWVFAAPPSYVCRPGGSIFLMGTVPDQDSFLPPSLASRVQYEGNTRVLQPHPDEGLSGALLELGLQELPEGVWLKAPRAETPESFIQGYQRELEAQPASGKVADLSVLDPTTATDFYPKRWTSPNSGHTGIFVARRPQEFGAPIWCLALLSEGRAVKFIDLPSRRTRWRGSDIAWQYQMAVDRCRGAPQLYRKAETADGVRFDFFSPLPQWSQRRMMIFGHQVPRSKCLMSFILPSTQSEAEESFLQQRLWLERASNSR
jgi:hypothetical protein